MKTIALIPAILISLALGAGDAEAQLCNPADPLPATVIRDAYGVPHVYASDIDSLAFTNGYVMAADRLFEMEILRRAGRGTLSEILGASQLEMDISIRRDLYSSAEWQTQYNALGMEDKQWLAQFAAGINRLICEATLDSSKMPSEYAALGSTPANWTEIDTVAAADFLLGVFGAFGGDEVTNASLFFDVKNRMSRGKAKRLFNDHFPQFVDESPVTIPQEEFVFDDPLRRDSKAFRGKQIKFLARFEDAIHRAAGVIATQQANLTAMNESLGIPTTLGRWASNAILVSPALSESGNAVLLGGPQVGYAIPSFFFEVGLHAPTYDAVGVIPPIGPGIVIGRSKNFAYTITSGISDQIDTYLEELNPANPRQYLHNGSYIDMDCRIENFTVQEPPPPTGSGGAPTVEQREFCRTVHGPVFYIDEAGGAAFSKANAHRNLEMPSGVSWLRLPQTTNLEEFEQNIDNFHMSFNFHYADNSGNIAYFHSGRRPLRPRRTDPRFPLPGTGEYEWTGFLAKSQMPRVKNPAQGWVANWNNRPARGWSSGDTRELWGIEHRVQALHDGIVREIAKDGKLSADDVNAVMFEGAKKDTYAGGKGAVDGRPALDAPYKALAAAVDGLPAILADFDDLSAAMALVEDWIEADTAFDMTGVFSGQTVARTVHGAPLIDTDNDGFYQHTGAAIYSRWRELLQTRVFGDEMGAFLDPIRYQPSVGANTGDRGGGDTQDSILVYALRGKGATGRRTLRYFDDISTRTRERPEEVLVDTLRDTLVELGDCLAPSPSTCRLANHTNVFSSLGAASNQTIGTLRGAVNRGSFNQIVELSPTVASVSVSPPGQSGLVNATTLAQLQAPGTPAEKRQITDDAHLTDQLDIYERFEYKPMPFTMQEAIDAQ